MWFYISGFINYHWETFSSILKLVSVVAFCQTKKQATESPFDKTHDLELLNCCFVKISVWECTSSPSPWHLCLTQFNFSLISFIFAGNPSFYFSCRLQFLSIHLYSHQFSWLDHYFLWDQSLSSDKNLVFCMRPSVVRKWGSSLFQTLELRICSDSMDRTEHSADLKLHLLSQLVLHHLG